MCYKYIFYIIKYLDDEIRGKYTIQSTPNESDEEYDENKPTPPPHEHEFDKENENGMLYK